MISLPVKVCGYLCFAVFIASGMLAGAVPAADAPEPQRVVVVANSDDPESLQLADYYVTKRWIPKENIVALPLSKAEAFAWQEFTRTLLNPLRAELATRGWLEMPAAGEPDQYGRSTGPISGHRISYMVLIRGVPSRIVENPAWKPNPVPPGMTAELVTNCGSVDGELALLAIPKTPVNAFFPNPLYQQRVILDRIGELVVRVARLDGPTAEDVRAMCDSALAGERDGLIGRAYVDIGGKVPQGDVWMESVARQLVDAGFDTQIDRTPRTFSIIDRFDAPVIYFGWYAWDVDGPFTLPGFRFPSGAIAMHIHSFSASSLRTATKGWCGPFIARGVAATVGNVYEPYLHLTHHPELLIEALLRGETWGAAAYYALPGLSWQATALGDPLYRPFGKTAPAEGTAAGAATKELQPYVELRQIHRALSSGNKDAAAVRARGLFRKTPSIAVGVSVAEILAEAEGKDAGVKAMDFLARLPAYPVSELGTVRAGALRLVEWGAPGKALEIYDKMIAGRPAGIEVELLEDGIRLASRLCQSGRALPWQRRLLEIKPPPSPSPRPGVNNTAAPSEKKK